MLLRVLLLLALALLSAAQSPTTSSAVPTHTIAVGADPFKFTPKEVNASVGDIIEFRFYPTNHSVARAEYRLPCIPYEVTGVNKVGFWSGFEPISIVGVDQPKYHVRINDTEPIFYYCGAPGACTSDGMVGVINPNVTQTWETQYAYALNATQAFVPGEYFASEGVPTTPPSIASSTSIGSSSPTASSVISPAQTTVAGSPGKSSSLSTGAIAGIAIGASAIAVLAAALFYLYGRQRTMKDILQNSQLRPGLSGRESHLSGQTSPYPFSWHKSPVVDEYSPKGRDRYSGTGVLGEQHSSSNPLDSESHRSRSPPMNDRGREIQPLNMDFSGAPSPYFHNDVERRHDSVNGAYRTPTPRGQLPEGEEEQTIRPRGSEERTDDSPAALRTANAVTQRTKTTRLSVHEMPVPSQNPNAASLYQQSGRTEIRQEVLKEK